jgi:predicted MFS family arabinose efflux permease
MSIFKELTKDFSATIPILAMLATGVISTLVLLGLPILVGGMASEFQWGDFERGWLASADMTGSAIASLIVIRRVARLDWQWATRAAVAAVVAGNLASIFADTFGMLMTLRILTGLGNGVVLSIVFTGLCHSRDPDRFFGLYVLAQLALQVLLLATLPGLIVGAGMQSVYVMLAAAAAASGLLTGLFPSGLAALTHAHRVAGTAASPGAPRQSQGDAASTRAIIALIAQATYFLAVAALWGYYEGIGRAFSLSMAEIGNALAVSALAGMAGAVAVIVLGSRSPRMLSMVAGTIVSIAAALLLIEGSGHVRYMISASLFNFAWNYTFPYQMGVLAQLDRQGSVAVISLLVQLAGLALGPALAALLLAGSGYDAIILACVACYGVSLALFVWSARPWT